MRTLSVCLLVACGVPVDGRDAGDPFHPDGGGVDAGFMCAPGEQFCSAGKVWSCTINGDDAVMADGCDRGSPTATYAAKGACRPVPACDGGILEYTVGSPVACCYPKL